ncbi:MAG: hypothetical protein AAF689_05660 [Pseudomonadota bacterium]
MTKERKEIEALLPFLANDTLAGQDRADVQAAVDDDAGLAAELQVLKAIRDQMQAEPAETSPGELGLARLMRDIDREAAQTPAPVEDAPSNVVPLSRLRLWQAAAVVVLGIGIGQAVLTPQGITPEAPGLAETEMQPTSTLERSADGADFALAGADAPVSDTAFRVIFAPDTTERQMRTVLLEAGLEIVAGPSSIGFYDLAPLDGDAGRDAARQALVDAGAMIETLEDVPN